MSRQYTEYARTLWTTQPKQDMTKVRSGLVDAYRKAKGLPTL